MRFSDAGFIRQNSNTINLELFNASHEILNLTIGKKICLKSLCFKPREFNLRVFGLAYEPNLLKNILTFKPIFSSLNLKKTPSGFIQRVKTSEYDIIYEVKNKSMVSFNDKKRKILIKLRKINKGSP